MSNSKLPNGGYTLTNGSNYMLDGFQFDTEYNGGVLEKARLPEAKGITALPTGMIPPNSPLSSDLPTGVEVDLDLDLSDFTKDASEQMIPLVDHSWLASLPEENLEGERTHEDVLKHFSEGRFEHPQVNQLKTLEDSWATGGNTGLEILPNSHRKHERYQNSYGKNQSQLPGDDYRKQVEKGSRKLAYGNKMASVSESVQGELNDEYGLHGHVYIKESSFPGLFNHKWDEVINKRCASALYIVANHEDCVFDRFLGKKVVASVQDIPWREAYITLMPKLEVYGIKKVSGSSYQSKLKQAFIDYTEGNFEQPQHASTWFQIQPDESNLISLERAKVALDQFEVDNPFVESWQDREQSKEEVRLQRIATQLVAQSLLEEEIVSDILQGDRTASDKIQRLYEIASQPAEKSTYEGRGKDATYHTPYKSQIDPSQKVKTSTERDVEALSKRCQEKVAKLIQSGLITISEVEKVTKVASSPEDKLSAVYDYLAQPSKVQTYMGEVEAHYMGKKSSLDPNAQIISQEDQNLANRHKVAIAKISKLVNSGLISHDEVALAIKGKKLPEDRVASVFEYLAKPKQVQSYDGHINKAHIITSTNKMPTAKVDATSVTEGKKIEASINHYISNGFISEEQAESALKIASESKRYEMLYNLVVDGARAKKSEFKGQKYSAHIAKKASMPTKTPQEAQSDKVATWLRQKMSEGSAGQELDILLSSRFSQQVLDSHKDRIASLRSEHEGISGHAYVDSEAYMTQGTDGCDKGALIHRANQIPTLLKNAKCGGCVFNVGGTCQKYNKYAVDQSNEIVEDKDGYQKEMIRLANASDSEKTASLFVNNYDEGEFNLQQDHNVDFSDAPSLDKVGEVLFGGFEI